jgi:arylsulfatase A-like enzyme
MKKLALLFTLLMTSAVGHSAERPPNIVFFLVDDLGWSDVGCYGSDFYETPNIDQLAQDGVRFTQAYSTCHVCSPSRASILTGKYPARLKMTDWLPGRREFPFQKLKNAEILQALPMEEQTLAETLKAHGYATAIFGKWHLGEAPSGPSAHGFDLHKPKGYQKGWPKAGYHAPLKYDDIPSKPGDYLTDRLTDEALDYIEENREKPFFLYLSHYAVHDPIQGRPDLVEKYRAKRAKVRRTRSGPEFILEGNPDDPDPLTKQQLSELAQRPSHQGYKVLPRRTVKIKQCQDNVEFASMVEAMDESLGRVTQKLSELGLTENTIVIFTSDNGGMSAANVGNPNRIVAKDKLDIAYATSNLPLRGAKGWNYEGGIRVPAILKWPRHGKAGTVSDEPVIGTDFYPTILEMAGLSVVPEQTLDGTSLVPALKGEPIAREAIYWHFPHYSNHGMQSPGGAIRAGAFKLLDYFENGTVQLFNLKEDPGEQNDLAKTDPETAHRLHTKLKTWRESVNANQNQPNPEFDPKAYPPLPKL